MVTSHMNDDIYVDPDLRDMMGSKRASGNVSVLAYPESTRQNLIHDLRRQGAYNCEEIGNSLVRARIPKSKIENVVALESIKSIEQERPVMEFGEGN